MSDDRYRRSEGVKDRGQMLEIGGQRSGVGGLRSDVRGRKDRCQRSDVRGWLWERNGLTLRRTCEYTKRLMRLLWKYSS